MSLKNQMKNLDIMTASRPTSTERPAARNLMSGIIKQAGEDLREKVKTLEAELARHREQAESGRAEVAIPINAIERPDLVMRSEHYWKSERYQEIKESIRQHDLQEPITVRLSDKKDRYILVKGDTRLNAHRELLEETGDARWSTIRARIEDLNDETAILMMVIENRDREDVCAYDQAVFHRRVCDEIFDGDRKAVMDLLNISESWLSRSMKIALIPNDLMNTFPLLYQAGARVLYPLAGAVEANPDELAVLMEKADSFKETSPARLAARLQATLKNKSPSPAPTPKIQQVTSSKGELLAEVTQSRNVKSLRIDTRAMPGFAELVEQRLADIYEEWKKSHGDSGT